METLKRSQTSRYDSARSVVAALANVAVCALMTLLVGSQLLGGVWDKTSLTQQLFYGRSPLESAVSPIAGTNDEPYSDRNLVCIAQGRSYVPMQLSRALENPRLTQLVDATGDSISGYRVIQRRATTALDATAYQFYLGVCNHIDQALGSIQDRCERLGYNITRDVLRIVPDIDSKETKVITRALPILIMPFWDNSPRAHFAIPGWDGMACTFRLYGLFVNREAPEAVMRGVVREVRAAKTVEWLKEPEGEWRNGWYEDGSGQRWNADMDTSDHSNVYGLVARIFDVAANTEYKCDTAPLPPACSDSSTYERWGVSARVAAVILRMNQAFISNGTHFGVFMFEGEYHRTIENQYTLEALLSNVSISSLCVRWLVALAAMFNTYRRGLSPLHTTGIGSFSNSRAFILLPAILLPRLKIILAAFWTVGCDFQGEQVAMSEAWFAMYPAIVEFVLLFFSILNLLSKILLRRVSDRLFGPTLVTLVLLHFFRSELASSAWLKVDGRVVTRVTSTEFDVLHWYELLTPSIALRLNGDVSILVNLKLVILSVNLLPLLLSKNMTRSSACYRSHPACGIEQWLALRASNVGGLGVSKVYARCEGPPSSISSICVAPSRIRASPSTADVMAVPSGLPLAVPSGLPLHHVLLGYEVSRLGYIVFGDKYLMTYEDWYVLTTFAPLRIMEKLWNYRVTVFDVAMDTSGGFCTVLGASRLCRLDDEHLRSVPWYSVTACSIR